MAFNKDEFLEKVGDLAEDASVKAASLLERLKPTMTTAAEKAGQVVEAAMPHVEKKYANVLPSGF